MAEASLHNSEMQDGCAHDNVHAVWSGLARWAVPVLLTLPLLSSCRAKQANNTDTASQAAGSHPLVAELLKDTGLAGQVVLIEFGTLGCELSDTGLDAMIEMSNRKTVSPLAFVRLEASGDDGEVESYYAGKASPFRMVRDKEGALAKALRATALPSFVLRDKFGSVRYLGNLPDDDELHEWVGVLAAERTRPDPTPALFGKVELDVPKLLAETLLPNLMGTTKSLNAYRGDKGLLIVFVDTDCPFAGAAIGQMPVISKELADFKISSVLVNLGDPADVVTEAYRTRETGTPVAYDISKKTQLKWNIESVPTVVLVTPKDRIVYSGPAVWADLAFAAEQALSLPGGLISFPVKGSAYG